MADVVIFKDETGKLSGFGEKGAKAWAKFRKTVDELAIGETLSFSWAAPRSPGYHRRFFARLGYLFDMQEQFEDIDALRSWLTVGAGEADFVPGPKGRMVAMPRSIKWAKLDQVEFELLSRRVDEFLWTDHAQRFLWPHLTPDQTQQMIEALDIEFS